MGLGWLHEVSAGYPGFDRAQEQHAALDSYRKVVALREKVERTQDVYGIAPDSRLALEAAEGILRIGGSPTISLSEREVRRLSALVKVLETKPMPITPILVPLNGENSLADLLDPARTTGFDLAGDGVARTWPWVRSKTGILVWDPSGEGRITSGRQLFGSATWWMFFRDGYEALASLDANRDGWLADGELAGIRIWQDQNGNGRSDAGEVRSLAAFGITALATRASGSVGLAPVAEQGVRFANGRVAATYDWVPTSQPISSLKRR